MVYHLRIIIRICCMRPKWYPLLGSSVCAMPLLAGSWIPAAGECCISSINMSVAISCHVMSCNVMSFHFISNYTMKVIKTSCLSLSIFLPVTSYVLVSFSSIPFLLIPSSVSFYDMTCFLQRGKFIMVKSDDVAPTMTSLFSTQVRT